ncbi:hypothetical protein EDB84DRAFT_1475653 [Lactarius hengduanensis]|nr:hypothetical protein EDB84DRAFT_1475653 [Lactarius hengduanensis]
MLCQLTLAFWCRPRARRVLTQGTIGRAFHIVVRAFVVMFARAWLNFLALSRALDSQDADVIKFMLLDARVIGSALCQLRSTF